MPKTESARISNSKRDARRLSKAQRIPLANALDVVAILQGHANWSLLMAADRAAQALRAADGLAASCSSTREARVSPQPSNGPLLAGFVAFDDPSSPGAGWACRSAGQPARIGGIHELPTDTLWWSNVPYETFFHTTDMSRNPWLRHDAYLVTRPRDAMLEWDLDPQTAKASDACMHCAAVFGRVMSAAAVLAGECGYGRNLFTHNTLRSDLKLLMPEVAYPKAEAASIMVEGQAFTHFTRTTVRGAKDGRLVMLRRPRMAYALEMLATPVPSGAFEFRSRADLRSMAPDAAAWLQGTEQPCMVEVTVEDMQPDAAPIYGFGNSVSRERRIPRSWVPHPEFRAMSDFSVLEVRSAYVGSSTMDLDLSPPIRRFLGSPWAANSWTCGVIAETLWRSIQILDAARIGAKRSNAMSWQGAWLASADKVSMFRTAMHLTNLGHPVMSYGNGWIYCNVPDADVPQLVSDGFALGLVPRMHDMSRHAVQADDAIDWRGRDEDRLTANIVASQNTASMEDYDNRWHAGPGSHVDK
jgi:hypothetical protein